MMKWNRIGCAVGVAALGSLLALPALAAPGDTVGSVLSASGAAHVEGPEGRRPLGCGESLREGERILTSGGANVSVTVGDTYLQLAPNTVVQVNGRSAFQIDRGLARFIDLGEGAGEIAVGTPHAELAADGGDTEIAVDASSAEFCEAGGTVSVNLGQGTDLLSAGQCVTASGGAVRQSPPHQPRVALSGAQDCIDIALVDHLNPTDVAAPPPSVGLYPFDPDKRTYLPCDTAGSCGGVLVPEDTPTPEPEPTFGFGTGPADPPRPEEN